MNINRFLIFDHLMCICWIKGLHFLKNLNKILLTPNFWTVSPTFHYSMFSQFPVLFSPFYVTAHNKLLRDGLRLHFTHAKPYDILQSFPCSPLDGSLKLHPITCWAANGWFFSVRLRQMKGSVSTQFNSINRRVKPGPPHCSMNKKQFCQFNDHQRKHTQPHSPSHSSSSMPRASAPCSPYRH